MKPETGNRKAVEPTGGYLSLIKPSGSFFWFEVAFNPARWMIRRRFLLRQGYAGKGWRDKKLKPKAKPSETDQNRVIRKVF
jgi:hypothetical protein